MSSLNWPHCSVTCNLYNNFTLKNSIFKILLFCFDFFWLCNFIFPFSVFCFIYVFIYFYCQYMIFNLTAKKLTQTTCCALAIILCLLSLFFFSFPICPLLPLFPITIYHHYTQQHWTEILITFSHSLKILTLAFHNPQRKYTHEKTLIYFKEPTNFKMLSL